VGFDLSGPMRGISRWVVVGLMALAAICIVSPCVGQAPDNFRWIDFHSPKDEDVSVWVTRALDNEKWTAIREIGVQYDAALVITTLRATSQSAANEDTFSVWSVSLSDRTLTPVLKGANLRLLDWMLFKAGGPRELGLLYDDCNQCAATTFLTAFYYDLRQHTWAARWLRGGQAAPIWSANSPQGVVQTQIYAVMADSNGRETLGTWNHLEYGKQKPAEDFLYRYDTDPLSGVERTQLLFGRDAASMKERICRGEDAVSGLSRGQDSALCQPYEKPRPERRPVTTPPANNQGQSRPPGAR
jgi:hypothetical protein